MKWQNPLTSADPLGRAAHTGWSCWKWTNTALSLRLLRYSRTSLNIWWGAISGQNPNQERAGISPLPVTLQAACSNTCHQIHGLTSQKAFLQRDANSPPDFCHRKKVEHPITKQTEVTSAPLSANGNVQSTKINKYEKKSRTIWNEWRTAHQGVQAPTGTAPLHQVVLWTHPAEVWGSPGVSFLDNQFQY